MFFYSLAVFRFPWMVELELQKSARIIFCSFVLWYYCPLKSFIYVLFVCLFFTGGWCVRERSVHGGGKMGQSK